jgi:AcrR family transcriptional regulator
MMRGRTRESILSASLDLFAKRGYSATTTEQIAKKAKVSKGLIFSHFDTKQDILFAIVDEQFDRIIGNVLRKDDSRAAKEKLISFVDATVDLIKNEPLLVRLSLQLNLDDGYRKLMKNKKTKEYLDAFLSQMKSVFTELGSTKPELDSFILMFMFDGIIANYTVAPELFPIDAIKDHLIDLLASRWASHT